MPAEKPLNRQCSSLGRFKADSTGSLAATYQADALELQVQVGRNGNDQIVVEEGKTVGEGIATLDVSGTTVRIVADGDIAEGTSFQIFGADVVTGLDGLNLLLDDPSLWDVSSLSSGVLVFGAAAPGLPGDIDGDGTVGFPDFLVLSSNFGMMVAANMEGDLDGDGNVGFPDFLILSNNFGSSAAATSSVPEPTGFALLSIAGLLGGLLRRRRR